VAAGDLHKLLLTIITTPAMHIMYHATICSRHAGFFGRRDRSSAFRSLLVCVVVTFLSYCLPEDSAVVARCLLYCCILHKLRDILSRLVVVVYWVVVPVSPMCTA
jgi:hypothetical protein